MGGIKDILSFDRRPAQRTRADQKIRRIFGKGCSGPQDLVTNDDAFPGYAGRGSATSRSETNCADHAKGMLRCIGSLKVIQSVAALFTAALALIFDTSAHYRNFHLTDKFNLRLRRGLREAGRWTFTKIIS